MSRGISCLLLGAVALTAAPADAQKIIEWWGGPYRAAFEEAKRRNVPVLIGFIQDGEEANDRIVAGLYQDADFKALMLKVVPIIASMDTHQERAQTVRGRKVRVCSKFGAIPCDGHRGVERDARKAFWGGAVKTPSHVVVLPSGKEVGRLVDVHPYGSYESLVKKAQQKLGRGLSSIHYREIDADMRALRRSLRTGELGDALQRLPVLEKRTLGHPLGKEVEAVSKQIDGRGQEDLEAARKLQESGDALAALRAFDRGSRLYKNFPVGKDFKKSLAKLKRTRDGRAALKVLKKEERFRPLLEKGKKQEREGDYVKAVSSYDQVVSRAQGTPVAEEAQRRIDALQADPEIKKLVTAALAKKQAERMLREAGRLRRGGKQAEAKAVLEKLIATYPDTAAAKKAKKQLEAGG